LAAENPSPQSTPPRNLGKGVSDAARTYSLIFELPVLLLVCIGAGGGIGYLIDRAAHTSPAFTLILGAVGFVVGIFQLLRALKNRSS
jgi:F0F1-type ATP synthase assembly protein I